MHFLIFDNHAKAYRRHTSSVSFLYCLHRFSMLRFMLILEGPAEEFQEKNSVDASATSIIKYLDSTTVSFRLTASACVVYTVCLRSLNTGVSLITPGFFRSAAI